jgi:hypothetical protein
MLQVDVTSESEGEVTDNCGRLTENDGKLLWI